MLLAASLWEMGAVDEAERIFSEVEQVAEETYVDPVVLSVGALRRGDVDGALDWLAEGLRRRAFLMLWTRAIPRYRPLRAHPRSQKILRSIWPEDEIAGVPS